MCLPSLVVMKMVIWIEAVPKRMRGLLRWVVKVRKILVADEKLNLGVELSEIVLQLLCPSRIPPRHHHQNHGELECVNASGIDARLGGRLRRRESCCPTQVSLHPPGSPRKMLSSLFPLRFLCCSAFRVGEPCSSTTRIVQLPRGPRDSRRLGHWACA